MGRPRIDQSATTHGFYNSGGEFRTRVSGVITKANRIWGNIRGRIQYLPIRDPVKYQKYIGVSVCTDWLDFQNFAKWFSECRYYCDGWQLDKDLLVKGNTTYSPDTCVFLPPDINKILNIKENIRGDYPIGVSEHGQDREKGMVDMSFKCKNPDFAFRSYMHVSRVEEEWTRRYKPAREGYVKFLAGQHREALDPRAYEALMRYEINMED